MSDVLLKWGSFILAAVGAVGGWEAIKYVLNRKTNQKVEEAKAFMVQREAILADYLRVKEELAELNKKVDDLYSRVHTLEEEKLSLISEKNELLLQLKEAEKHVCLQPDDACLKRIGYGSMCRLVGLIRGEYLKDHPGAIVSDLDMKGAELDDNVSDQIK